MVIQELIKTGVFPQTITTLGSQPEDINSWDRFILNSPHSLPTQLSAWKEVLQFVYNYPCFFLMASEGEYITGVLPLFQVNSPIIGNSLQSMPGGLCAANLETAQSLIRFADSLARELKVDFLLLRDSRFEFSFADLEVIEAHRGVVLELSNDPEDVWKKLPKDVRYHIRHGKKQGEIKVLMDPSRVKDFYRVFSLVMRNLGTPIFSINFLLKVAEQLPKSYQLTLVCHSKDIIGGYFNLVMNRSIYGMWGGVLHAYKSLKATHQAYWSMIEDACASGITCFDMGRSPYPSSQFEFKEQWGDRSYPIYQLYKVYRGKKPQTVDVSKQDGINTIIQWGWRYMPIRLTHFFGPLIRWHIPFG